MESQNFELTRDKLVHFIGIGGINMSSLAHIMLTRGFKVSGSDSKSSLLTDELKSMGAEIFVGQKAENINENIQLVVFTAAIHPDNPELKRAHELGIPAVTRADFLGWIMKGFPQAICISGTHGKTTTTSALSQIFLEADADPTIMSGGIMPAIGGNTRIGHSGTIIAEACEYTNSFLSFFPTIAVILNVKADHLDFFKDLDDIRHSFREFARLLPADGKLVIYDDIEEPEYFTDGLECGVVTFGLKADSFVTARNIAYNELACGEFDLVIDGEEIGHVCLNIPGQHGITNSLAAAAAACAAGIEGEFIIKGLNCFTGVDRRFQIKGEIGGVTIIDDYAHHPDEINATLDAALNYPHKKLWVVFQPHTYSRTEALMDDFASALSRSDAVVLAEIYAAREKNEHGISSKELQEKIAALGCESYYFATFDAIETFLLENCEKGDVLITMGAGDVVNIGEKLLGK